MDNVQFALLCVVALVGGMFGVQEILERRDARRARNAASATDQHAD